MPRKHESGNLFGVTSPDGAARSRRVRRREASRVWTAPPSLSRRCPRHTSQGRRQRRAQGQGKAARAHRPGAVAGSPGPRLCSMVRMLGAGIFNRSCDSVCRILPCTDTKSLGCGASRHRRSSAAARAGSRKPGAAGGCKRVPGALAGGHSRSPGAARASFERAPWQREE